MAVQPVIRVSSFTDTIGVNTHIDFVNYGYQNLSTVEASIDYLGLKNIRDSVQTASDAITWLQVAQATGAKFDDYIPVHSRSTIPGAPVHRPPPTGSQTVSDTARMTVARLIFRCSCIVQQQLRHGLLDHGPSDGG